MQNDAATEYEPLHYAADKRRVLSERIFQSIEAGTHVGSLKDSGPQDGGSFRFFLKDGKTAVAASGTRQSGVSPDGLITATINPAMTIRVRATAPG